MEVERQKPKILSYTAQFRDEGVRCAEKGNCRISVILGADESNVRLWQKHKALICKCEVSWKILSSQELAIS
jgi:hypothetical protein